MQELLVKGNQAALNAISEKLKEFSKEELLGIFQNSNPTLNEIAFAARQGNPAALNAISKVFLDNSSDFYNLIKLNKQILELIFSQEFFKKNIRFPNFDKLITKIQDTSTSNLTHNQKRIYSLYKEKVKILMSQFKGGFRYKSNIAEAKRFLDESDDNYKKIREICPNLLIDHLISQWNEYSDLETPDKDINSEIKELINLLSQQEVGYYKPSGNLKIRDLANYLDLQINQNDYLNTEHIFLKKTSFRQYCESFIKFCKKSGDICNILSIGDQDSVIKEHLYLIFSNGENSPNMQKMKTLVDYMYEYSFGSCIKRGDMSVENLLETVRSCQIKVSHECVSNNVSHECGSNKRSCSTAFMSSSSSSGQGLNGSSKKKCKTEKTENSFR